jgi:hypothetical protein
VAVAAAAPVAVTEPPPVETLEPEAPPPIPELQEIDSRPIERQSGTPIVRIMLWGLMCVFLTVPLIFMGVYVMNEFRKWDKKLQKIPKAVVAAKKVEPEIPDNIDWEHPDWNQFGEWTGTGGGQFGPITVDRSRLRFIMEASPSRGAKKPETVNFRLINADDTAIQSLIGGMRAPGRKESDSYEYRRKKGWPLGTYNLQVEAQGKPSWRVVGLEDLQFPDPSTTKLAPAKKK